MARWLPLLLWLLLPACYRYVPARPGSVPDGSEVRLHLSREGAVRVEPVMGRQGSELEGVLERWGQEVVVSVRVPPAEGVLDRALRNRVVLSSSEIVAVDVRERDRTRTALLAAGLTGVAGGALISALSGVFGGYKDPVPPVEEDSRIPILRFSLPR